MWHPRYRANRPNDAISLVDSMLADLGLAPDRGLDYLDYGNTGLLIPGCHLSPLLFKKNNKKKCSHLDAFLNDFRRSQSRFFALNLSQLPLAARLYLLQLS